MRGHVRKRGKKWSIVVDIGNDPKTGKRQQKWFSGYTTKKEAEIDLARIVNEIEQNTFIVPSNASLAEYLNYWLGQQVDKLATTTIYGYKVISRHIIEGIGHVMLKDLKPLIIQEYYNNKMKTLSKTTVLHHHRMLRKSLQDAVKWQLITMNPCDSVEAPRATKYKAEVLDTDEIKILLSSLEGNRLEIPISIILFLGLRRSELLALQWADIDHKNKTIIIQRSVVRGGDDGTEIVVKGTKNESSMRTIPLTGNVLRLLDKQRIKQKENGLRHGTEYVNSDYIFTQDNGEIINPATFSKAFGNFLKTHNLKHIRLHDLRHTNATLMLAGGIPAKVASERLGHSNISTTMDIYSHVLKDMEKETSDKLDSMIFGS